MEFGEMLNRAKAVKEKYALVEAKFSGKPWGALERTQGFVVDAGELMKVMMAKNGLRKMEDVDRRLSHELSDCLWSVMAIADDLGIDLEKEFAASMDALEKRVDGLVSTQ